MLFGQLLVVKLLTTYKHIFIYFAAVNPFRVTWSERKSSAVRHRNELTVKAWEKAIQELGKWKPRIDIQYNDNLSVDIEVACTIV